MSLEFDGSGSTDDGTIQTYEWDFGDGNIGSGERPTHTYAATGNYTVTLTVTDNDGVSSQDQTTAAISEPAPVDYKLANLRAKTEKDGTLSVIFNVKNQGQTPGQPVRAQLFVDDPSAAGEAICEMDVSDEPGGKAGRYKFSAKTGCTFAFSVAVPGTHQVTVRLLDANPDILTENIRVRAFSRYRQVLGLRGW
jgi:hypothetical protein